MPKSKAKSKSVKAKSVARAQTQSHTRAKRAVTQHGAPGAKLQYIPWHAIALEALNPLLQRQYVVGQEIMLAPALLKKGCIVSEHSHHSAHLTYIFPRALRL